MRFYCGAVCDLCYYIHALILGRPHHLNCLIMFWLYMIAPSGVRVILQFILLLYSTYMRSIRNAWRNLLAQLFSPARNDDDAMNGKQQRQVEQPQFKCVLASSSHTDRVRVSRVVVVVALRIPCITALMREMVESVNKRLGLIATIIRLAIRWWSVTADWLLIWIETRAALCPKIVNINTSRVSARSVQFYSGRTREQPPVLLLLPFVLEHISCRDLWIIRCNSNYILLERGDVCQPV